MLEKTAVTLEPCSLQRVFPIATNSLRTRRQLHTAFWQHGAADLEVTNAWQALMHGVFDSSMDSSPSAESGPPALRASSFLLDFLYPSGALAFLRRSGPVSPDRWPIYKPHSSYAKVSPRLYSSSTSDQTNTDIVSSEGRQPGDVVQPEYDGLSELQDTNSSQIFPQPTVNTAEASTAQVAEDDGGPMKSGLTMEELQAIYGESASHSEDLEALLLGGIPENADKVWYHYTSLDALSRQTFLGQTLVFLSKTGRVTDSWKISELFYQIEPSQWDGYVFVAGLEAEMNLQNVEQVLEIYAKGLEKPDIDQSFLIDALDIILAAALKSPTMDILHDLWKQYDQITTRFDLEGITSSLGRVSAVAGLSDTVLRLADSFRISQDQKGVAALAKLLVRRAVLHGTDDQILPLLRITEDHLAYEEFIRSCRGKEQQKTRKALIVEAYQAYRTLSGSKPSHAVLHNAFHAYVNTRSNPIKFNGLEMLWGDWQTFHGQASRRAYQKFMGVYAAAGDKKKVISLWTNYAELYATADIFYGDDFFTYLLQVHAVRQESVEVERIFDEISSKFGLTPNRHCWNILLNAHVKVGDFEAAISTFERLSEAVGADHYSYGTLMQMAADRGELGYTIELYRSARRQGVHTNDTAILGSLIQAYCENDLFSEAEGVCTRAAKKGINNSRLWNIVLRHYALRRNLVAINRLLGIMTEMDIYYNKQTYSELLLGLSLCRQSQHALHLLSAAIKDNAFEVDEDHFHIVMGAFIKTGQGDIAARIHKLMQQCGLNESAKSITALLTAFSQWKQLPHKQRTSHLQKSLLAAALSRFYAVYGIRNVDHMRDQDESETSPLSQRGLLTPGKEAFYFGRLIYIFTQMRDYAKVDELIDIYRFIVYGNAKSTNPLPIKLLNSIMWADLSGKKYTSLRNTWKSMLSMAIDESLSVEWSEDLPHTNRIAPRYRHILSDGLKIMQTVCIETEDAVGLHKLIEEVRTAGFEVDSKNWNLHVQGLIRLNQYWPAFEAAERWLMPGWTGWKAARAGITATTTSIPLDMRQRGLSPRQRRPLVQTLYYLAKGYMELDRLKPWSPQAAEVMRRVERACPTCVTAINSMIRTGSDIEQAILAEETAMRERTPQDGDVPGEAGGDGAGGGAAQDDVGPTRNESESPGEWHYARKWAEEDALSEQEVQLRKSNEDEDRGEA